MLDRQALSTGITGVRYGQSPLRLLEVAAVIDDVEGMFQVMPRRKQQNACR